ncbi:Baseplate protein J-like [uncultured Caudovirales phage]|uniref:Baseplate protein J-like n=1 Tax=uncultured Caudovirales phage TaxID=2100421 RepID=A0A6J5N2Q8_9CAUD|nr:Baseplate protein J-like [uncultured Caudovirales phage]
MAQVNYTARDYDSLRTELINVVKARVPQWTADDAADFTLALVESFAYMGDLTSYYIDRAANEATIKTATQKKSLLNFAETIGYKPSGPTPARVVLTFKNNSNTQYVDIPVGTQAVGYLSQGLFTEAYYETLQSVTQLAPGASVDVPAIEGSTSTASNRDPLTYKVLPVSLGTSNGYAYTEKTISAGGVVDGSVIVYVGQGVSFRRWTYVTNMSEYGPNDKVYSTRLNADNSTTILFGDGINGQIPESGDPISAVYRSSTGSYGNIVAKQITTIEFIPGLATPPSYLSVTNNDAAFGGADGENLEMIRRNLTNALNTRNRCVTLADYEQLALTVPGTYRTSASSSVYTSVNLYLQPDNDYSTTPGLVLGSPTSAWSLLATKVHDILDNRSPANTTISIFPPEYVGLKLEVSLVIGPAYKQRDIKIAAARAILDLNTGLFSFTNYGFASNVTQSEIIATLMAIPGVLQVDIDALYRDGDSPAIGNITMAISEIPYLESTSLTVNVSGGIA